MFLSPGLGFHTSDRIGGREGEGAEGSSSTQKLK